MLASAVTLCCSSIQTQQASRGSCSPTQSAPACTTMHSTGSQSRSHPEAHCCPAVCLTSWGWRAMSQACCRRSCTPLTWPAQACTTGPPGHLRSRRPAAGRAGGCSVPATPSGSARPAPPAPQSCQAPCAGGGGYGGSVRACEGVAVVMAATRSSWLQWCSAQITCCWRWCRCLAHGLSMASRTPNRLWAPAAASHDERAGGCLLCS